jgi:site-specific DNA recombinase
MELLEEAIWQRVRTILEDPETVLAELRRRQGAPTAINEEVAKLERLVKSLDEQRQRVIKLYRFGDVDDEYVEREMKQLNRLTANAEGTITQLKARAAMASDFEPLAQRVKQYCSRVRQNLEGFDFADKREVLAALQVRITVSPERAVSLFCVLPAEKEEEDRYLIARRASA